MLLLRDLRIAVVVIGSLLVGQSTFAGSGPTSNIFIGPDTNGDGASDPVIEDSASGFAIATEMNGLTQIQAAAVPGTYGTFSTVGWADIDGDGKSDKIIHDDVSGFEVAFTAPADIGPAAGVWSAVVVPGSYGNFETLGFRDIDGDGNDDKIMEDMATGYMVGFRTNTVPFDDPVSIPGSYGNFETRAVIDIDGDGNADKVMEDSVTGYTVVTLLADVIGNSVTDEIPGSYGDFVMTHFADVNGDGTNDKIMELRSGGADDGYTIAVMLNTDLTYTIIELPATYLHLETLGYPDLNGDGQADQLIRGGSAEGEPVVACIYGDATGAQMVATCRMYSKVAAGQVFEGFADLNGDKKVDRVMRDTTTGDLYGTLSDGLSEIAWQTIIVFGPASTYVVNEFDDAGPAAP